MDLKRESPLEERLWAEGEMKYFPEPEKLARGLFLEKILAIAVLLLLMGFALQFWILWTSEVWLPGPSWSIVPTLAVSLLVGVLLIVLLMLRWRKMRGELQWRIAVDRQLNLLKSAVETMEIGITISDVEGKIRYLNRAEAEMHGYAPSEIIGRDARILAPEQIWNPRKAAEVIEGGFSKRESLNIRKDGTVFPVQLISDIVYGRDGSPVGIVTSCEDISDRRQREDELKQSRLKLRDFARHLERVREEERSAIAHEIHNDIGASLTVLKLDMALFESKPESEGHLRIEKLHAMEESIDEMIDRIRRLSRRLRPFLLDDAGLEAAVDWYSKDFSRRTGIPIELEITELSEPIGNEARELLFRTFQEGVTNSLRHASPSRIQIRLTCEGPGISISVKDDGSGCAADPLRFSGGFGLLALRERAGDLGGSLDFVSSPGEGSTLRLWIPRRNGVAEDDLGSDR